MKPPKANYGALWSWIVGLTAALVLGLLIVQTVQNTSPANVSVDSAPPATQASLLSTMETPLATVTALPTLPATETSQAQATPTPLETEADIEAILTQKWIVYATWEQYLTANPIVQGTPPTGILEEGGADFYYPTYDVIIYNKWQDVVNENGEWALVCAGSMYTDPTQGLVLIPSQPVQIYLTPTKAGSVRIVAVQNLRLTLISENGTTFYFDVPGRRFVDSLTEVAPTVTPYRSSTPTPTETPAPTVTLAPTCTPGPTPGPPAADVTPLPITCS